MLQAQSTRSGQWDHSEVLAAKATKIIESAPAEHQAAVGRRINDRFRTDARDRTRKDSKDVRDAIQFGSVLLEQRPRDVIRFINAVRLQFLVMDQTLGAGKDRAKPEQVGKWTAMMMRWPVLAEEIRWSSTLLTHLESWATARAEATDKAQVVARAISEVEDGDEAGIGAGDKTGDEVNNEAEKLDYVPDGGWPPRVKRLINDPVSSERLYKALREGPPLNGANLHGLLPVQ